MKLILPECYVKSYFIRSDKSNTGLGWDLNKVLSTPQGLLDKALATFDNGGDVFLMFAYY